MPRTCRWTSCRSGPRDVVEFVGDGAADLGVTGANLLAESGAELPVLLELGYGRCALEAAVPADAPATTLAELVGMRLATTHPNLTRRLFGDRGIPVEVVQVSGAVEVAPRMGLADGIVDLVSTGSTLVMNGLRSVGGSCPARPSWSARPRTAAADADRGSRGRDDAGRGHRRRGRKYLMMNAPTESLEAIEALLPGLESPSIMPLAHAGMAAVHAVVGADEVWGLLARLHSAGAIGHPGRAHREARAVTAPLRRVRLAELTGSQRQALLDRAPCARGCPRRRASDRGGRRAGGDAALREANARFGGGLPGGPDRFAPLRLERRELEKACDRLPPDLRAALDTMIANVGGSIAPRYRRPSSG